MTWSTLADLPNEILLLIFQHFGVDDCDVLTIGKLCQRLNSVALPYFLRRKGFTHPENSSIFNLQDQERCGDALAALSLDFSVTSIKQLAFVLDTSEDSRKNIHRINNLVSRLSTVTSLRLVLRATGEPWALHSDFVIDFINAILSLLEVVHLKSCESFQIVHSHPFSIETNYVFQVPNRRTPLVVRHIAKFAQALSGRLLNRKTVVNGLHGQGWRYRQISPTGAARAPVLPSLKMSRSRLSTLDLNSDFLCVPPFSMWIVGLMKQSAITSLSLSLSRSVTLEEFRHFLFPEVAKALPFLEELKVAFTRDEFLTTIVENLHHLRLLRRITLALAFFGELPPVPASVSPIHLPDLVSFTGSLPQAAYLFAFPVKCPNLRALNIVVDFYFRKACDRIAAARSFSIIQKRFLEQNIDPCVSICISDMEPPSIPAIERILNPGDYHIIESLLVVSRMTLTLPAFFLDEAEAEHQAAYALAWINAFGGVQDLTLLARTPVTDEAAREVRDSTLRNVIFTQRPDLRSFNVVDLLSDEYHAHWSNFRDEFARGIDGLPSITMLRNNAASPCVCCDF